MIVPAIISHEAFQTLAYHPQSVALLLCIHYCNGSGLSFCAGVRHAVDGYQKRATGF